jgi:hypothetical protein
MFQRITIIVIRIERKKLSTMCQKMVESGKKWE